MSSRLMRLLREVFPTLADNPAAQPQCWVSKTLKRDRPKLKAVSEAIQVVERYGQIGPLPARLKREHPVDKPHQRQYDERLLDALTEACAFAWADLRNLGSPRFSDAEGAPDIHLDTGYWVEAKAIHSSLEEAKRTEAMLEGRVDTGAVTEAGPGLFNKFDSAFADAGKKFNRQGGEANVVFFNLTMLDSPQWFADDTLARVAEWAGEKELREPATRVVICYSYDWREPVKDGFSA